MGSSVRAGQTPEPQLFTVLRGREIHSEVQADEEQRCSAGAGGKKDAR